MARINNSLLPALLLLAAGSTASAQCNPSWNAPPGVTYPEGVNGTVRCSVLWDPDGSGPLSQCLVIGGDFDAANSSGFNHIAMWDGSGWKPLHIGVNGTVRALTIDTSTNSIIAGGSFSQAGLVSASKVARYSYNTGLWSAIGSGITSAGDVRALTYDPLRNQIYVGGNFTQAGGVNTGALARITGASYAAVPAFFSGVINALLYYEGDGSVYVGGTFVDPTLNNATNVMRYYPGNSTWFDLAGGLPGAEVNSFIDFSPDGLNHRLVAGGSFGTVNGRVLNGVAYYAGSSGWFPLGTGFAGTVQGFTTRDFGRELYAVGTFTLNGTGNTVNRVAKYTDGSASWSAMGGGLDNWAYTAATYKDAVYVGGQFTLVTNTDSNATATRIAMWDGAKWGALKAAPSGPVRCMVNTGSALLIGGSFDLYDPAANTFCHNLATFDGSNFHASVNVHGFNGTNGPINAIMIKGNGITIPTTYVAGSFTQAGGVNALNIAAGQFSSEFSQVGSGVNGEVYALATYQCTGSPINQVCGTVAVGNFTQSGSTATAYIARWGPGAVSLNLGTGLSAPGRCLLNYQGKLLVGGDFTSAGGTLTGHLAQWDGTTWTIFNGSFVNDSVRAMTVYNGNLVIAGAFTQISGAPAFKAAMWNGSAWIDMGAGIDTSWFGTIEALAVLNGELYAGGSFATNPGQPSHIARWNGSSWVPVDNDTNGNVAALNSLNGILMAGGGFTRAGSAYAPHLAQFTCSCWANCDNSSAAPILNTNDFQCFMNNFAAGTQYANCDGSATAPVLNANDFQCFLNKYAAGCN